MLPNIRPLSASLAKLAAAELNENPATIASDLQTLKDWIKQSPHLRGRSEDQFLLTFLRGCKYSLERAKQKYDMFYSVRAYIPEVMTDRDPTGVKMADIIRLGVGLPLPNTETPDGPRIILIRPGAYDANIYTMIEVMKISNMLQDIMMIEDDNYVIAGQTGIVDLAGVTLAHFMQFNPTFIKKVTMMSQEASPTRQKGFHFINTPFGFDSIFNIFKSFMSDKNKTRLYIHGSNLSSLYEEVPQRLMPEEYGGECGSIKTITSEWEKKLVSYKDYYKEEESFGVDERKRIGPLKNVDSVFGSNSVSGTFRQINVD